MGRIKQLRTHTYGYKKVVVHRKEPVGNDRDLVVVKLLLPAGTRVWKSNCVRHLGHMRVSHAFVMDVVSENASKDDEFRSTFHPLDVHGVRYRVGKMVRPHNGFSSDTDSASAPGIHCFSTQVQAEEFWKS